VSAPRIVLFGPMGIGKTTALRTLCGDDLVDCEVANLDTARHAKATTTVGADFGVLRLDGGEELHLYGSPGQARFGFMRHWLLSLALGALVLTDVGQDTSLDDTEALLREVSEHAPGAVAVVLVARPATVPEIQGFARALAERLGGAVPVLAVDVRERAQLIDALALLVALLPETLE